MRRSIVPLSLLVAAAVCVAALVLTAAGPASASSRIVCPQHAQPASCCPPPTHADGAGAQPICCPNGTPCCPNATTCCNTTCCTSGTCCAPTPCIAGSLTIASSPNPSKAGRKVVITGALAASAASGAQVVLWRELAGQSTFHQVAQTTTDSAGDYTLTLKRGTVMANQAWYVTSNALRSATVQQLVEALVGLSASAHSTTVGQAIVLRGHVTPAHSGETVLIEQKRGGVWRVLARTRLGHGSSYSLSHRFTHKGTVELRTLLRADARNDASTSSTVTVAVK